MADGTLIDMRGRQFSSLTVMDHVGSNKHNKALWTCFCTCGTTTVVLGSSLRNGTTRSCGCLKKVSRPVVFGQRTAKHGHKCAGKPSASYNSWISMKSRCTNPKATCFEKYGGSGVSVSPRWLGENGFQNFLSDLGERPAGTTLGRFNDAGNYEPGNVSWQTWTEQAANRRPDRRKGGGWNKKAVAQTAEQIAA